MKVFDKNFNVCILSFEDNSRNGDNDRRLTFTTNGDVYHYNYYGGHNMALSSVVKENRQTGGFDKVYSPWEHIPDGGYYEEIGRRLSVQQRCKKLEKTKEQA